MNLRKHETELDDAWNPGMSVLPTIAGGDLDGDAGRKGGSLWRSSSTAAPKREIWHVASAMPTRYKRATARCTRVQLGATRVARHTPATLCRQTRFFF